MGFKNRENMFIMRRTVLYMAISLDGFIADENGGLAGSINMMAAKCIMSF